MCICTYSWVYKYVWGGSKVNLGSCSTPWESHFVDHLWPLCTSSPPVFELLGHLVPASHFTRVLGLKTCGSIPSLTQALKNSAQAFCASQASTSLGPKKNILFGITSGHLFWGFNYRYPIMWKFQKSFTKFIGYSQLFPMCQWQGVNVKHGRPGGTGKQEVRSVVIRWWGMWTCKNREASSRFTCVRWGAVAGCGSSPGFPHVRRVLY